jgi:hypothetical protein
VNVLLIKPKRIIYTSIANQITTFCTQMMVKRGLTSSIFAAATEVTSALNQVNLRDKEKDDVSNKLKDVTNNSKSIKSGDKCHNVSGQTRDQTSVTSPILFMS